MRRILIALTLGALAVGTLGAPASAATTRMVAKDGKASPGSCSGNGAAYKTIQAAVKAANAGDTILVCPGTYREQVVIGAGKDRLTLRATPRYGATIKSPADLVPRAHATSLVLIRAGADRVTVEGFRLKHRVPEPPESQTAGPSPDCSLLFGIQVDGTRARILFNTVRAIGPWTLGPCGMWYGIGTGWNDGDDPGDGASSNVRYNAVRDTLFAGVVSGGDETSTTAFRNVVRFYHLSAQPVPSTATGRLTPFGRLPRARGGARPSGPGPFGPFAGVIAFGGGAKLIGNTAESGPGAGPLFNNGRPYLYVGIGALYASEAVVRDNRAYRAEQGILVAGSELLAGGGPGGPIVSGNLAVQNYDGIYLEDVSGGLVEDNRANSNIAGLIMGAQTSGVTVRDNVAINNIGIDCVDDTGPDLGSILNTWTDNTGYSDDPDGICQPAVPF